MVSQLQNVAQPESSFPKRQVKIGTSFSKYFSGRELRGIYVFISWKSFDYLFQEQCNYRIVKKVKLPVVHICRLFQTKLSFPLKSVLKVENNKQILSFLICNILFSIMSSGSLQKNQKIINKSRKRIGLL